MNLQATLAQLTKMFPGINVSGAVAKAQAELSGVPDNLDGARAVAERLGLSRENVEQIYNKYGNTKTGRGVCAILGTTPEALKQDAERLFSVPAPPMRTASPTDKPGATTKFPRLK